MSKVQVKDPQFFFLFFSIYIAFTMILKDSKTENDLEYHDHDPSVHETAGRVIEHDDVFGEISEDGPNYRNVSIP